MKSKIILTSVLTAASMLWISSQPVVGQGPQPVEVPTAIPDTEVDKTGQPVVGSVKTDPIIPNQYIVVFKDDMTMGSAQVATELASTIGGTLLYTYTSALRGFAVRLAAGPGVTTAQTEAALQTLTNDLRVAFVEQDRMVTQYDEFTSNAVQPNAPWGLDRIDQVNLPLNTTYAQSISGANVRVYVIDSGIRTTHSDFGGRATLGRDFVGDGLMDCTGHGTHVAGTIGGATFGVAKGVRLINVRVLNCSGSAAISTVAAAVDWVTANRVLPSVVNMSLGAPVSSSSAVIERAIQNSINAGVTYVVAAGNDALNACNYVPARIPTAITVAASTRADADWDLSNFGSCMDLFAPGVDILSAGIANDTATRLNTGTSMASPHVAGAAAIYLHTRPNALPAEVARAVADNATTGVIGNLGPGSPNLLLRVTQLEGCDVNGEGVYLFEHVGYGGRCMKFTADMPSPLTWTIGNDAASSIQFVGKWRATVFQHDGYQGNRSAFTANDPSFLDDAIGNDQASSIRVERFPLRTWLPMVSKH